MKLSHVLVDIELTNRCNALCTFCPRDMTPQQGFISREDFYRAVERVRELPEQPKVTLTGQGEPTLHPDIVEFMRHVTDSGLRVGMTSNASRLTPALAEDLLAAGLKELSLSISDFDEDYEEVYNLDFRNSMDNALHFISINEGRCQVTINIVEHDINCHKIEQMKEFWRSRGVGRFLVFGQNNRGGACQTGKLFTESDAHFAEAARLMRQRGISSLCDAAFKFLFVGWNGNYYVCCNDYEKTTPLGHVAEKGFAQVDQDKLGLLACGGIHACNHCDLDPTNRVREALHNTLEALYRDQQSFPGMHEDLDWREKYLAEGDRILARSS